MGDWSLGKHCRDQPRRKREDRNGPDVFPSQPRTEDRLECAAWSALESPKATTLRPPTAGASVGGSQPDLLNNAANDDLAASLGAEHASSAEALDTDLTPWDFEDSFADFYSPSHGARFQISKDVSHANILEEDVFTFQEVPADARHSTGGLRGAAREGRSGSRRALARRPPPSPAQEKDSRGIGGASSPDSRLKPDAAVSFQGKTWDCRTGQAAFRAPTNARPWRAQNSAPGPWPARRCR